jgi:mRNA-degrading endonuclease RelE of RelBE toxin-antitoxin system
MPTVRFSPEGVQSLGKLPTSVPDKFNEAVSKIAGSGPSAPSLDCHQLSGGRGLWTLRIGVYRGIFSWDGAEARFIRFGHRRSVYFSLPK